MIKCSRCKGTEFYEELLDSDVDDKKAEMLLEKTCVNCGKKTYTILEYAYCREYVVDAPYRNFKQ